MEWNYPNKYLESHPRKHFRVDEVKISPRHSLDVSTLRQNLPIQSTNAINKLQSAHAFRPKQRKLHPITRIQ